MQKVRILLEPCPRIIKVVENKDDGNTNCNCALGTDSVALERGQKVLEIEGPREKPIVQHS